LITGTLHIKMPPIIRTFHARGRTKHLRANGKTEVINTG
jgi:hypothetical protein